MRTSEVSGCVKLKDKVFAVKSNKKASAKQRLQDLVYPGLHQHRYRVFHIFFKSLQEGSTYCAVHTPVIAA